jgi:DNA-binding YbaB/EbfC family protein
MLWHEAIHNQHRCTYKRRFFLTFLHTEFVMNIPGLGNIADLVKQAQQLQEQIQQTQHDLRNKTVQADAGAGMVTVTMNGAQELVSIKIDPSILASDNAQMVQDLIVAAVNKASLASRQLAEEEIRRITGGLPNIPGLSF